MGASVSVTDDIVTAVRSSSNGLVCWMRKVPQAVSPGRSPMRILLMYFRKLWRDPEGRCFTEERGESLASEGPGLIIIIIINAMIIRFNYSDEKSNAGRG